MTVIGEMDAVAVAVVKRRKKKRRKERGRETRRERGREKLKSITMYHIFQILPPFNI